MICNTRDEKLFGPECNQNQWYMEAYWCHGVQKNRHILTAPEHLLTAPEDL